MRVDVDDEMRVRRDYGRLAVGNWDRAARQLFQAAAKSDSVALKQLLSFYPPHAGRKGLSTTLRVLAGRAKQLQMDVVLAEMDRQNIALKQVDHDSLLLARVAVLDEGQVVEEILRSERDGLKVHSGTFELLIDFFNERRRTGMVELLHKEAKKQGHADNEVYNRLMQNRLGRGDIDGVIDAFCDLIDDELVPNSQTYSIILSAVKSDFNIDRFQVLKSRLISSERLAIDSGFFGDNQSRVYAIYDRVHASTAPEVQAQNQDSFVNKFCENIALGFLKSNNMQQFLHFCSGLIVARIHLRSELCEQILIHHGSKGHKQCRDLFAHMVATGIRPSQLSFEIVGKALYAGEEFEQLVKMVKIMDLHKVLPTEALFVHTVKSFAKLDDETGALAYMEAVHAETFTKESLTECFESLLERSFQTSGRGMVKPRIFEQCLAYRVPLSDRMVDIAISAHARKKDLQEMEDLLSKYYGDRPVGIDVFRAVVRAYVAANQLKTAWSRISSELFCGEHMDLKLAIFYGYVGDVNSAVQDLFSGKVQEDVFDVFLECLCENNHSEGAYRVIKELHQRAQPLVRRHVDLALQACRRDGNVRPIELLRNVILEQENQNVALRVLADEALMAAYLRQQKYYDVVRTFELHEEQRLPLRARMLVAVTTALNKTYDYKRSAAVFRKYREHGVTLSSAALANYVVALCHLPRGMEEAVNVVNNAGMHKSHAERISSPLFHNLIKKNMVDMALQLLGRLEAENVILKAEDFYSMLIMFARNADLEKVDAALQQARRLEIKFPSHMLAQLLRALFNEQMDDGLIFKVLEKCYRHGVLPDEVAVSMLTRRYVTTGSFVVLATLRQAQQALEAAEP